MLDPFLKNYLKKEPVLYKPRGKLTHLSYKAILLNSNN